MYAASGLRVSRGAGAFLAAALVARWALGAEQQPWLDLAIGVFAAFALLRQLWHPRMYGRFTSWGLAVASAVYAGGLLGFLVLLRSLPNGFWWVALALAVTWAYDTFRVHRGTQLGSARLYDPHLTPQDLGRRGRRPAGGNSSSSVRLRRSSVTPGGSRFP